jgi:1,4-dihydroxy-2-naphthoyl-CoA hydrolase
MIWKNKPTPEFLNELSKGTAVPNLGITFTELGDDFIEATMPVDHRTMQPMGILHGGASALLAETLGSVASSLCVDNPLEQKPVGIEINASHLKSVSCGYVIGRATPIRLGKRLHVWQIEIKDEEGAMICISRLSVMIL